MNNMSVNDLLVVRWNSVYEYCLIVHKLYYQLQRYDLSAQVLNDIEIDRCEVIVIER